MLFISSYHPTTARTPNKTVKRETIVRNRAGITLASKQHLNAIEFRLRHHRFMIPLVPVATPLRELKQAAIEGVGQNSVNPTSRKGGKGALSRRPAILLIGEEDSYQEIASILGATLSATKALIHCGRKELKQKLLPYLHSGIWAKSKGAREKPQTAHVCLLPREAQARIRKLSVGRAGAETGGYLRRNAQTAFGKAQAFEQIRTYEEFARRVRWPH